MWMSSMTSGVKIWLCPSRLRLRSDFLVVGCSFGATLRSLAIGGYSLRIRRGGLRARVARPYRTSFFSAGSRLS